MLSINTFFAKKAFSKFLSRITYPTGYTKICTQNQIAHVIVVTGLVRIRSDASNKGWGVLYQGIPAGGEWNLQEQQLHINVLEMKTVKLALLAYHKHF